MNIYYVYQLVDPRNNKVFYIGKGKGRRAYSHAKFQDGNENLYKNRIIQKIISDGQQPIVEFLHENINDESLAYMLEEKEIARVGLENLTNLTPSSRPPSRKGWKPSRETLLKRSRSLKGIPRSNEWKQNLSKAKQGKNNPMYGKKFPCTAERQYAISKAKNLPVYPVYKQALEMMRQGISADETARKLGIGRGICFQLKNGTHGIFIVFPELRESETR